MVPISDVSDKAKLHETASNKGYQYLFAISQPLVRKQPYLLGLLSHINFLNTILMNLFE